MPDEKVTNINETDNHNMSNSHVIDKKISDIIQDAANKMTSNGHVTDPEKSAVVSTSGVPSNTAKAAVKICYNYDVS